MLNVGIGTMSLVYDGISFYYAIHYNYTIAVMYIGISIILGIVFLISCNLYDAIIAEIEDRKHKRIQRKIHRDGGNQNELFNNL
jgi:hypothetical protein